ncbi:O-methyltransferase [Xylaria digitata]|nr:O-methyltransferase [Xylaria digitata]
MSTPNNKVLGREPSLLSLAQSILETTQGIVRYLDTNSLEPLSFALRAGDPPDTPEYRQLHAVLKDSLEDLSRLIDGPRRWLRSFCCTGYDLGALQIALDFDFFGMVPIDGGISLEDLAQKAGLDQDRVGRVVHQLMTYRIFDELEPSVISHSSTSLVMREDEDLRSVVHYSVDEMLKAAADCNISLKANPFHADQQKNPFVTRHSVGLFEFYAKDPEKARQFAKAMAGLRKMDNHLDFILKDGFDWSSLEGTVVDVGGGNGHISRSLAQIYPRLQFVVQDYNADMLAEGQKKLTDDIRDRVGFSHHSFFDPQPCRDVAAFLIRQCTHNWADDDCVKIFRSFVLGLEGSNKYTPLLINDIIIPAPGEWPRHQERVVRQVDVVMLVNCGAKQRTKAEFEELLKKADPRFEIRKVRDDGPLGLLEVYLNQTIET